MRLLSILGILGLPLVALAQHNTSTANGCDDGFFPGIDTVIFTVPYTYSQVLSIIGSFRNITWSGSPYDTVTLNGTDDTVGTARTYDIDGAHVIETIEIYEKPPNGPYYEVHSLNTITIPAYNLSAYSDYDATTVVEICNGLASTFNFTISFCATNATLATGVFHTIHMTDAQTVGVFLGGQNFTSCAALAGPSSTTGSTTSSTSAPATFTGAAVRIAEQAGMGLLGLAVAGLLVLG